MNKMRYFSLIKVRKDLKRWSPHVLSFDFLKTPPKIRESAGQDWETIKTLPFIRLDDNREILINTSCDDWEDWKNIFMSLDGLPDEALRDLNGLYKQKCKGITMANARSWNDGQTNRNVIFLLLPELLWAHGNDNIKSRIFN